MPELPEVETIRRHLAPVLTNSRVTDVKILRPDIIEFPSPRQFQSRIKGQRILGVTRKGKYLLFFLTQGWLLIVHLRLSGHLRLMDNGSPLKYERLRLILDKGKALIFIEPRVLGRAYLVRDGSLPQALTGLTKIGTEPLSPQFTMGYLAALLKNRKAPIKTLLLNQRICAGVGNIYSDEALFFSGIKPTRPGGTLKKRDTLFLVRSLRMVLRSGIRYLGTTMRDGRYRLPDGGKGEFQDRLMVFNREGIPCRICGTEIRRIKIGNRSSYYCPRCQK